VVLTHFRQLKPVISDKSVDRKSDALSGRRIAFGVCGGIGAVETVRMIRELRRHGAEITTFLTPAAKRFITELSLTWATQGPVIEDLDAQVEHLDPFDIAVVAPLTLNTLTKCALGIADNSVSMMVASQLGRRGKVVMVPAMNDQLAAHPLYVSYRDRLREWGTQFYPSPEEEGRLKMPAPDAFAEWVIEVCGK